MTNGAMTLREMSAEGRTNSTIPHGFSSLLLTESFMERSIVTTFQHRLDQLGVTWTSTTRKQFASDVLDVVDHPVVGMPLPFEGISLPEDSINVEPSTRELEAARSGVTGVSLAVASYGTIVIHQSDDWTEPVSLFPPLHIAVLRCSDIVPDMTEAFRRLSEMMSNSAASIVLATGPSATADMGALVHGAHGPESVHIMIVTDL